MILDEPSSDNRRPAKEVQEELEDPSEESSSEGGGAAGGVVAPVVGPKGGERVLSLSSAEIAIRNSKEKPTDHSHGRVWIIPGRTWRCEVTNFCTEGDSSRELSTTDEDLGLRNHCITCCSRITWTRYWCEDHEPSVVIPSIDSQTKRGIFGDLEPILTPQARRRYIEAYGPCDGPDCQSIAN